MGCTSRTIFLAHDTALQTERNGDATVVWDGSGDFTGLTGANSVLVWFKALEIDYDDGSTTVSLVAQGSIDGKTWGEVEAFAEVALTDAAGTMLTRVFVPGRLHLAPLVRFGLQIACTDGPAQARVSVAVAPVFGDNEVWADALEIAITGTTTGAVAGTEADATGYSRLSGQLWLSGASSGTWTGKVEGSYDGTNRYDLVAAMTLTVGGTECVQFGTGANPVDGELPRRIRVNRTAGNASDGALRLNLLLRAF